jgi:hypothetical protein
MPRAEGKPGSVVDVVLGGRNGGRSRGGAYQVISTLGNASCSRASMDFQSGNGKLRTTRCQRTESKNARAGRCVRIHVSPKSPKPRTPGRPLRRSGLGPLTTASRLLHRVRRLGSHSSSMRGSQKPRNCLVAGRADIPAIIPPGCERCQKSSCPAGAALSA